MDPAMNFLWPQFLWLLLALPLLVLLYVLLLRRKKKLAVRYASLSIVKEAMGAGPAGPPPHSARAVPAAMAALLLAAARPVAVVTLPSNQQTIILAMDVSGSMRATDVQPNRLVAAQNAAKAFIGELPRNVKVGIVAFAGSAQVAQLPTVNREDLVTAIDRFQLQRATATGNAIVISLATLFPDAGIDLERMQSGRERQRGFAIDGEKKEKKEFTPVAPGSYHVRRDHHADRRPAHHRRRPAGRRQDGADRGVRVYTVGIGTVDGETIGFEGWSMRVRLDEETLKAIAQKTSAEYFYAGTAQDLKKVYETLSSKLTVEKKETEISALFAMAAAALAAVGGAVAALVQPDCRCSGSTGSSLRVRHGSRTRDRHGRRPPPGDGPGRRAQRDRVARAARAGRGRLHRDRLDARSPW
jgi:Ca-activated chloride channel family protein